MANKQITSEHQGHRQRMKERLLHEGLENMPAHEAIELLLYYAVPYRDTNGIGHRLISTFGNVHNVLAADYADLIKVAGVTPHMATLIVLCNQLGCRSLREAYEPGTQLFYPDEIAEFFIPQFVGEKEESVVMVSMDTRRKVINTTRLFRGSVNSARFSLRDAVRQALQDNATVVAIAHNHPGSFAFPSNADIRTTIRLIEVLATMDVRLADHVIVSDDDAVSLAATEKYAPLFDTAIPLAEMRTISERFASY